MILAGLSSSRAKDVCTSKQEVVGSYPIRVTCEVFFHRHLESTEYAVLYIVFYQFGCDHI